MFLNQNFILLLHDLPNDSDLILKMDLLKLLILLLPLQLGEHTLAFWIL